MSAFPRPRPNSAAPRGPPSKPFDPLPKRIRTARCPTSGGGGNSSKIAPSTRPTAAAIPQEPEPRKEDVILEELTSTELRVNEFLRDIQSEFARATAHYLDTILGIFSQEAEALRSQVPEVQNIREVNEELERNIDAMCNLR